MNRNLFYPGAQRKQDIVNQLDTVFPNKLKLNLNMFY